MRKVIGYLLSWFCFILGDAVSRLMNVFDWAWWLYPVYNRLMSTSTDIQTWGGGHGPWEYTK